MSDYETCPTMTVIRNGTECVINVDDFDPATDKKGDEAPKRGRKPAAAPTPAAPAAAPEQVQEPAPTLAAPATAPEQVQLSVKREGDKFFVVDAATKSKVTLEGVDENGYDTDVAAIKAAQEAMKK